MDDRYVESQDKKIRKIEDIIDIQKANGNFNVRQVAFKLPFESNSSFSASLAKSLETGLSKVKLDLNHKKTKKCRSKRKKRFVPDVISWPSDSDITVLRMRIRSNTEIKDKLGNVILGDGLHQPDSSSMVNLATLILHQPLSKPDLNVEEYLLPLSSWERTEPEIKQPGVIEESSITSANSSCPIYRARCSHNDDISSKYGDVCEGETTKSKLARFLRLYFCPCCTCLYNLEKMEEEPSACYKTPRSNNNY